METLRKTVNARKALATYCKKSGLNNKLSCSIKQSNETRWNSLLVMLKSIKKVENEVKNLLEEVGEMKRVDEIDFVFIDILIKFLEIFQEVTLALEGDVHPTIHHVFQWYTKLQRSVARNASDLPTFIQSINFLDPLIFGGSRGQQLELDPPSISILCNK